MQGLRTLICLVAMGNMALADIVVPTHTIRPNTVLSQEDFTTIDGALPGSFANPAQLDGLEAKVALYAGRPVLNADVGAPAIVERNAIVQLVFSSSGLQIMTEGRALGRGAVGDVIRVMNLTSKSTLSGRIRSDGMIEVAPQ